MKKKKKKFVAKKKPNISHMRGDNQEGDINQDDGPDELLNNTINRIASLIEEL